MSHNNPSREPMRLWKIVGTGFYFGPFYVEADDIWQARARAGDILAGPASRGGRRSYGVVDSYIRDIIPFDVDIKELA